MNRSQNASRYGRLAEEIGARTYGLELDHRPVDGVRVDAKDDSGNPWDVKAAMENRKSGPGRFRFWKDQHDVLAANGGGYVLIRYRTAGNGIHVLGSRSIRAADLSVSWGGAGDHRRDSEQAKILAKKLVP